MSAMNFLAIQVILEIKSAIEKKKSSNVERDHGNFVATTGKPIGTQQYTLPKPAAGATKSNRVIKSRNKTRFRK